MAARAELSKNQTVVLQTLKAFGKPLSAYEILEQKGVRAKGITAPVTVYRALEKLVELGLVHRIESLNAFLACHDGPHLQSVAFVICDECRQIAEVPADECATLLTGRAKSLGFDAQLVRIEVSGRCPSCRSA